MRRPSEPDIVSQHGKVPPQATELEQAVLGAAMLERDGVETAVRLLRPDVFYRECNQLIFTAISKLYHDNLPVDILTVTEQLRKSGNLEVAGGPYYITTLTDTVHSALNTEYHCRIVLQKYFQRELIRVSSEVIRDAYEDTIDVFELIDIADKNIQRIGELSTTGNDACHIDDLVRISETELRSREINVKQGKLTGVPTGLLELDKHTNGWQNGNLVIWASRPGMGKSASMLHIAKSAAKAGIPVCIYSLEMSKVKLSDRLILSCCGISADKYRSGWLDAEDWIEFEKAKHELSGLPIYVDDNPMVSMRYIKNHARMMQKKGRCGMILVDYLQLTDMRSEQHGRNREQEVAEASRDAKLTAKYLNIPFHLLAQLSRKVEDRGGDKRPNLADLRESGAIEQDADIVIFIYRPEYYGFETDSNGNSTKGTGEFIIAKNRDGAICNVPFRYNHSLTKFFDYEPQGTGEPIPF